MAGNYCPAIIKQSIMLKIKKIICLSTIVIIGCIYPACYAQTAFSRIHNFCNDTIRASANTAQFADNNKIIVAGHTQPHGFSDLRCYIGSIDYNGNVLSSKILHSIGNVSVTPTGYFEHTGYPLIKTGNDRYLLAGNEIDLAINSRIAVYQPFFYFFNSNCDSILQVKYTDTIVSRLPYSVIQDKDNNLVLTGTESSRSIHYNSWNKTYNWDSGSVWLAKYDANANILWSRKMLTFSNNGNTSTGYKIFQTNDGLAYIVGAITWNPDKNIWDYIIIKTDLDGNIIWKKFLQRKFYAIGEFDLIPLKEGGLAFISSCADSDVSLPQDAYLYYGKLDDNADTVWTKKFRKEDYHTRSISITEAENNDLILLCNSIYYYERNTAIRTTPKGNIKWYREYRYKDTMACTSKTLAMSYTPSRQVFLSGYFSSPQVVPGVFDTVGLYSWFVLTDTFGCIEPGCQVGDTVWWLTNVNDVQAKPVEINIYPNPVQNTLFVEVGNTTKNLEVKLTDLSGRVIQKLKLAGSKKTAFDMQTFPPGLYLIEVWDEQQKLHTYKISKE
jgi:hypothetical protein